MSSFMVGLSKNKSLVPGVWCPPRADRLRVRGAGRLRLQDGSPTGQLQSVLNIKLMQQKILKTTVIEVADDDIVKLLYIYK
jgi:hypothetical protein